MEKIDVFCSVGDLNRNNKVSSNLIFGHCVPVFITIFIPTFKRAKLLAESIESAINQKGGQSYEIIVVDNNPERNDETELLMQRYKEVPHLSYYKNEVNLGMVGNWNRGYKLAHGKWVCMLHDDDLLSPDYLDTIVSFLNEDCSAVFCKSIFFKGEFDSTVKAPKVLDCKLYSVNSSDLFWGNIFLIAGNMIKKDVVFELGGFSEDYKSCADYQFFAKLTVVKKNSYVYNGYLAYYRIADNLGMKQETIDEMMHFDYLIRSSIQKKCSKCFPILKMANRRIDYYSELSHRSVYNKDYKSTYHHIEKNFLFFFSKVIYRILKKYYDLFPIK